MTQRIIGKSWYVDFSHQGKRYRIKSPDDSKKGAQNYELTLRRKLADGESLEDADPNGEKSQLFREYAWFWFETHVRVHCKPSMVAKVKGILKSKLIPFFGDKQIHAIRTLDVERYKSQQVRKGLANKTINNELSALSKSLRDAKRWYGIDTIPEIIMLKLPPAQFDYLSEDECRSLLLELSGVWFELTYVALKTGLRRGELQALRFEDIHFENKTLTVNHNRCSVKRTLVSPKGNRTRTIPLPNDVIEILSSRQHQSGLVFTHNDRFFRPDTYNVKLKEACQRANLRKVTPHVLRHSYASNLAMKGVPIAVIQQLLGHTDIKVTMRYAHLSQTSINDAVEHMQEPLVEALSGQVTAIFGQEKLLPERASETRSTR